MGMGSSRRWCFDWCTVSCDLVIECVSVRSCVRYDLERERVFCGNQSVQRLLLRRCHLYTKNTWLGATVCCERAVDCSSSIMRHNNVYHRRVQKDSTLVRISSCLDLTYSQRSHGRQRNIPQSSLSLVDHSAWKGVGIIPASRKEKSLDELVSPS